MRPSGWPSGSRISSPEAEDIGISIVWILLGVVVGAILQRSAGLDLALILAPVCVIVLGPSSGVMLVNTIAVCSSLLIIPRVRKEIDWGRILPLLAFALPGAIVGAWLVTLLDGSWLELTVGLGLLVGLLATLLLPRRGGQSERPVLRALLGISAGAVSTMAGSGGPIVLMYASLAGWPFRVLAASAQAYYLGIACIALTAKILAQPGDFPELAVIEWGAVLGSLVLSITLGNALSRRIPSQVARAMANALAVIGAVVTTARGLVGILGF